MFHHRVIIASVNALQKCNIMQNKISNALTVETKLYGTRIKFSMLPKIINKTN